MPVTSLPKERYPSLLSLNNLCNTADTGIEIHSLLEDESNRRNEGESHKVLRSYDPWAS